MGYDDKAFQAAEKLLKALNEKGLTLATAESCTGGMIGAALTAISGSSAHYRSGIISYANDVKIKAVGVPSEIIEKYTEVSAECAKAMAVGISEKLSADCGLSTTGYAGPVGGTPENPVGTVFIGAKTKDEVRVIRLTENLGRQNIREKATLKALSLITEMLKGR